MIYLGIGLIGLAVCGLVYLIFVISRLDKEMSMSELSDLVDKWRNSHFDTIEAAFKAGTIQFEHALIIAFCQGWDAERKPFSKAVHDVLVERQRQIEEEGWTPEHDDRHRDGTLALAAAAYAVAGSSDGRCVGDELEPSLIARLWPWESRWWKPTGNRRRNLVKATALAFAAIECIDRAAERKRRS